MTATNDEILREFAAEMQGRVRPPGTKSRGLDYCTAAGAVVLSRKIQAYWESVGFDGVVVELVPQGRTDRDPVFGIRSNLIAGRPPRA